MKHIAKNIFCFFPVFIRRILVSLWEFLYRVNTAKNVGRPYFKKRVKKSQKGRDSKQNILFYHFSGLSFGGTEKNLQILAKYLDKDKYNVYFLYSSQGAEKSSDRREYLSGVGVNLIEFTYKSKDSNYPYVIKGMKPSIFEIIDDYKIDVVVTATPGYTQFPINVITNIPIILINIFGSPTVQKNIKKGICISHEVRKKASKYVGEEGLEVMYIPTEGPLNDSSDRGLLLRRTLGFSEKDFVFGRIGRPSDEIFDPIGIRAFQNIVKEDESVHYLIMSPPPVLKKIVEEENIPNVHFLSPTSQEEDVWAFYSAIDTLAHFRYDGESFGLNIAEAMLSRKPIITHKSHIWNAHLEYLDSSFSRIAEKGNVDEYCSYMRELVEYKKNGKIAVMGQKAFEKGSKLFLIKNNIQTFEKWIEDITTY